MYDYHLHYQGQLYRGPGDVPTASRTTLDVITDAGAGLLLPTASRVAHAVICTIPEIAAAPLEVFDTPDLQDFADLMLSTPAETLVEFQHGTDDNNLLVISSMHIEPSLRGQNLSYVIMDSIREVLGRTASIIAINAAPEVAHDSPDADFIYARGRKALRRHWEEYGFGHVGGGLMLYSPGSNDCDRAANRHVW